MSMWSILFWLFWAVVLVGSIVVKLYTKISCGRYQIRDNISDLTVLITGATSGIGKETACQLAEHGARVIILSRTAKKGREVATEIYKKSAGTALCVVMECDLSSMRSVRSFVGAFLHSAEKVDVLINNAGCSLVGSERTLTEDNLETTLASNHLGHFLLTNLLLDRISASKYARIVVVSSILHRLVSLDIDDLNCDHRPFAGMSEYARTKLANLLFVRELSNRLHTEPKFAHITINAIHPGACNTDLFRDMPLHILPLLIMMVPFFKSADEGAQAILYAALSPELQDRSGMYLWDNNPATMSAEATSDENAKKLWEKSEKLTMRRN